MSIDLKVRCDHTQWLSFINILLAVTYSKNPIQLFSRHGDVIYKEISANAYSIGKTIEAYLELTFLFFFLQTRQLPALHKILTLARMVFKMSLAHNNLSNQKNGKLHIGDMV